MSNTNKIFNRICAIVAPSDADKLGLVLKTGHNVSKSKIDAWKRSQEANNRHFEPMPENVLTDVLDYVAATSDSPLVRFLCEMLVYNEDNLNADAIDALSELVQLKKRDYGYSPNNLRAEIKRSGLTQENFAEKYGISIKNIRNWLAAIGGADHRDMSYSQWRDLISRIDSKQGEGCLDLLPRGQHSLGTPVHPHRRGEH